MDAKRNAMGVQRKRRLTRHGVAVGNRRTTSPPPPESGQPSHNSGNPLPLPPIDPIPYPFNAQLRLDADMKAREKKFRNFLVLTPIYPDIEFLKEVVLLHDELETYFVSNNLGFVFGNDPGVFDKVVREFACSFNPNWSVVEVDGVKVKVVKDWNFRLGGRDFKLDSGELRTAFVLENQNACPPVPKRVKDQFWRMITKKDSDYKSGKKATDIRVPIWKFIHRLIATCIYLRKDEGRFVNSDDLEIMCCMHNTITFDPLCCITKALEEYHLRSFKGSYLGGGHFVTILARFVGFSLDPSRELPRRVLGEAESISRGLVKRIKIQRSWVISLVGGDEAPIEDSPPSSPRADQGAPSSTPLGSNTNDEILRNIREIAVWKNVMMHGDMMRNIYTHMRCSSYRSPPRPCFRRTTTRDVPSTEDVPMDDDIDMNENINVNATYEDDQADNDVDDSTSDSAASPDAYIFTRRNIRGN